VQKVTLDAGLSCPNRDGTRGESGCIYCDAKGSGTGAKNQYPDPADQVRMGMERLSRRYKVRKFIAYFQSFCNTYAPVDTLRALYDAVAHLPGIVGLSVATRPDCLNPAVLELLAGYADRLMVWLELGLQSIHDTTLARINRGHTYKEFIDGYMMARAYPLNICLHMIIGLPGEGPQEVRATAREIARLKPEGLKIHSLFIPRGTALDQLYRDGGYDPLSQQEFVQQACDVLEIIPAGTVIQRLTGDPDRRELIAPLWTLQKNETIKMIETELKKRGSRQGACYGS
jgi:hypothetical protein